MIIIEDWWLTDGIDLRGESDKTEIHEQLFAQMLGWA